MPSLFWNVTSRFLIWMVMGTSTVSLVTFHEVGAHVEGHQIDAEFVADDFFQIFKLDGGSSLQLGKLLEAIEFLGLQILIERTACRVAPDRCCR